MAHWSVGSGPGQEWLGNRWSPPVLALSKQTLGCARFGWSCSLFLEALETSRERPAFSFPSFTDGVILICYVFVRGFFCYYYLFISCLLFMALEKQSQNAAEAAGKLWAHLFGGRQAARLQTRWGRECLSATKCLCCVSRQWHLPDPGMQWEGEEPACFHVGHSLGCCENWFSKKLGCKAEHPREDQPTSDLGHRTTCSLCHLLRDFPAQHVPCWAAAFSPYPVTPWSHFWGAPNSAAIAPKHKCISSSWDAAKDLERARSL